MSYKDQTSQSNALGSEELSDSNRSLKSKKWLRTKEASEYLGISEASLRNLVSQRRILPGRFLGRLYFSKMEIDLCIEASRRRSP